MCRRKNADVDIKDEEQDKLLPEDDMKVDETVDNEASESPSPTIKRRTTRARWVGKTVLSISVTNVPGIHRKTAVADS